jgi:membrane protein YdbS with pleckstrin-like domain
MIKKMLKLIIEPLNYLANRKFAEKTSVYFSKNKWVSYVVALLFTFIILVLMYVIPNLAW